MLNGSRRLTDFKRQGDHWTAKLLLPLRRHHGECLPSAPFCNHPETVFVDDRPLTRVVERGRARKPHLLPRPRRGAALPRGRPDRTEGGGGRRTICLRKRGRQRIDRQPHRREIRECRAKRRDPRPRGRRWTIENCEVRLNSGAGIGAGSGSRVRNCDIHANGQIGSRAMVAISASSTITSGRTTSTASTAPGKPAAPRSLSATESVPRQLRARQQRSRACGAISTAGMSSTREPRRGKPRHRHLPRNLVQRGNPGQRAATQRPR